MEPQTNTIDFELFKMIQLLVFCSYLAVIWGAAVPQTIGDQELIVGGRNTSISEVPYQVALTFYNSLYCGGSILTPKYILTAAHCLKLFYFDGLPLEVRAGSSLSTKGGVVVQVKDIIYHPNFSYETKDYDVGIVELSTPLNFTKNIQPIKLVTTPPPDDAMVKTSGWGVTQQRPRSVQWLQSVEVPMVNHEICRENYAPANYTITPRMICAGVEGKDSCQGDSGGPLTYNGQLAGIVSFGIGCGLKNFPGVYTNVADPDIKAFINKHVPMDECNDDADTQ